MDIRIVPVSYPTSDRSIEAHINPCIHRSGLESFFFFQAEDGIRDIGVTGVQTCALPIYAIVAPRGRTLPITPGAVEGEVEDWYVEEQTVRVGGWAGDVETGRLADRILVYADDELLYAGRSSVGRLDLARRHRGLGHAGFAVELPRDVLDREREPRLRFFAIRDGRASELAYRRGFPWRG